MPSKENITKAVLTDVKSYENNNYNSQLPNCTINYIINYCLILFKDPCPIVPCNSIIYWQNLNVTDIYIIPSLICFYVKF